MPSLRTLLVLGRTSNLPTVWSNCLAGWWLAGHGNPRVLTPLLVGATLLYLGGMYLNDAFDAQFDSQHRRERPIPSGGITAKSVWQIGFGLLAAGLAMLFFIGVPTGMLGMSLVLCILLYDAVHKIITFAPIIMAGCRFLLYLVAASTGVDGITGWPVWCGLALASYIVGLSFLARKESLRVEVNYWPCFFLAVPIGLAYLMNTGTYRHDALLLSAVVALWVIRSLRFTYREADRNIGRSVASLLAGIVLVDLLAVHNVPHSLGFVFVAFFLLALLFQRFIPAT